MDEFIKKLIERLEEEKSDWNYDYNVPINKAIEIVNELAEEIEIGNISDGYHTFNELYHHRAVLFSVICNSNKDKAWKSKLHDTGDMYEGMFIVGIETPKGQATYHYDIIPYWDMFKVKELPKAPKWDGHTPNEAIRRIGLLAEEYSHRTEDLVIDASHRNGWIPCSERLPEENGWYLVTNELGVVQQQWWGANHWQKLRDEAVIAWQPLPEPYKPKEQPDSISAAWKQQTMSRFERVE